MIRNAYIASTIGVLVFFSTAAPAYALSLTSAQVSTIVSLLQSFGVGSQAIAGVEGALDVSQSFAPVPCKCPTFKAGSTSSCGCSETGTTTPPVICNNALSSSIGAGATGPEVSTLQQSLGVTATGYFGPQTQTAVTNWQSAHNLPATGYVGALTRAAFATWCGKVIPPLQSLQSTNLTAQPTSGTLPLAVVFSATGLNASGNYIINYGDGSDSGSLQAPSCTTVTGCTISANHSYTSAGTYTATLSPYIACLYSNPRCMIATQLLGSVVVTVGGGSQTAQPVIETLTPTSGPVGTVVTITGFGFATSNTILFDGELAERNVPITSSIGITCVANTNCHGGIQQTVAFTVPYGISQNCSLNSMCPTYVRLVTPGQYSVSVQNVNGTSNASSFSVTSGTSQHNN